MDRSRSVLVLVDYQERLMPAIAESATVLARAALLGRVAARLNVPVVATAQNPDRLGPNLPEIVESCEVVLDKMSFGACADGLTAHLTNLGSADRPLADVVIAGCEAHVCLLQTALPLITQGHRVWVAADASGSRRHSDHGLAMARLHQAGAVIVSTEMVAFEWLRTCQDADFKAVSALIKAG
ncbi:MAG: isochorismatase family protein [Austwickia sp.]|jgi:nicotinamidase-related amidase|nr:isochorismatase family protein [Austwickia sp.]MBK8437233.1 isochorismatase family protein [Austwickia sp.]MBK9102467.1 isochorismatase family protein [Austwickia sp.]